MLKNWSDSESSIIQKLIINKYLLTLLVEVTVLLSSSKWGEKQGRVTFSLFVGVFSLLVRWIKLAVFRKITKL